MITLQDIKLRIPITGEDEQLNDLIEVVEAQWIKMTNREFDPPATLTEEQYVEGYAPTNLFTRVRPVSSITTIRERSVGDRDHGTNADWETTLASSYALVSSVNGHIIRLSGHWKTLVEIVYVAGTDDSAVPADVRYALVTQLLHLRKRNDGKLISLKSQSFQGGQGNFHAADYHPAFLSTVALYKEGPSGK